MKDATQDAMQEASTGKDAAVEASPGLRRLAMHVAADLLRAPGACTAGNCIYPTASVNTPRPGGKCNGAGVCL